MRALIGGTILMMATASVFAQNMPAGAHSVDDHSREQAVNAQIDAAEAAMEQGDFKSAEEKLKPLAEDTPEALKNVIPPVIPVSQPVAHQ